MCPVFLQVHIPYNLLITLTPIVSAQFSEDSLRDLNIIGKILSLG